MKLHIIEGNSLSLDGGAMFGNAPKEMWQKWITPDEKNRISLATRSLLIQNEKGQHILLEAGVGAFFDPKLKDRYGVVESNHMLLDGLNELGIKETDINAVILSHLHFDHCGGLLSSYEEGPLRLLFPNAKYLISKSHWLRACHPHLKDRASYIPHLHTLLKESGRLELIENPFGVQETAQLNLIKVTIPNVKFDFHVSFSNGHTPGLMLTHIEWKGKPLVFVTDLIPGMPWIPLSISIGYDRFPELLSDEKKLLYEYLEPNDGHLFFVHDADVAVGTIKQDSKGKYFGQPSTL